MISRPLGLLAKKSQSQLPLSNGPMAHCFCCNYSQPFIRMAYLSKFGPLLSHLNKKGSNLGLF